MKTTRSATVAEPANQTAPWQLSLGFDASGRITATGMPLVRRGPLQAGVSGLLHDRAELAALGGLSIHHDDATLIAAAYERHGDRIFEELRGSFAVVVLDETRNAGIVLRDPVGSHAVFYAEARSTLHVADRYSALLAVPGMPRRLNRLALADDLCKRWPRAEETVYEGIKRLPHGSRLTLSPAGHRVERYWNRLSGEVEFLSEAEADRFDEQLERAVKRCVDAGPVGIFLSGGFDSISVAAVAADYARRSGHPDPIALSLGFPDPACDERVAQRSVAKALGLPITLLDFRDAEGPRGVLEGCLALNRTSEAPLNSSWMPPYMKLTERGSQQGVRTIVTGEGGDEWLNVSPYLKADLWRRGDLAGLYRMAMTWRRSFDASWPVVVKGSIWNYGLRPLVAAGIASLAPAAWDRNRTQRLIDSDPDWIARDPALRREQYARALAKVADSRPREGFYVRELRTFIDDPLMSTTFEEQHLIGQQLGVRFLHPYWDPDLVEHLYRTPPDVLTRGLRTKGLVRAAVARRFPGLGFERKKKVWALSFFAATLERDAPAISRPFIDFSALGDLGVVDPARTRAFVETAFAGTPRHKVNAWRLVVLESWVRSRSV